MEGRRGGRGMEGSTPCQMAWTTAAAVAAAAASVAVSVAVVGVVAGVVKPPFAVLRPVLVHCFPFFCLLLHFLST